MASRVTRKVRSIRAHLYVGKNRSSAQTARAPLSLKDVQLMDRDDWVELLDDQDALSSAASRLIDLSSYGESAHRQVPVPCVHDAALWDTNDHGLTYMASFAVQSSLFQSAKIPVVAICDCKVFTKEDSKSAAQALGLLPEREVESAKEMAFFRGSCDKDLYIASLSCPVVIVSMANPRRWTISVCDGSRARQDLFVDWIDGRIASFSTTYLDDGVLLTALTAPALLSHIQPA